MKKSLMVVLLSLAACSREVPVQKQSVVAPPVASKPRPVPVNYYEGTHAADAIQQIRAKVGEPFRVLDISIDYDAVAVKAQDPKKKENVDEYTVRRGELRPSVPVRLFGQSDQETLEANLFDPATVDWAKIPDILRQANEKIQLEGGSFTGISIERNMFDDKRPVMIDANYQGLRKNGYLRTDRHGDHPEVHIK
jgi:hypothetical protein